MRGPRLFPPLRIDDVTRRWRRRVPTAQVELRPRRQRLRVLPLRTEKAAAVVELLLLREQRRRSRPRRGRLARRVRRSCRQCDHLVHRLRHQERGVHAARPVREPGISTFRPQGRLVGLLGSGARPGRAAGACPAGEVTEDGRHRGRRVRPGGIVAGIVRAWCRPGSQGQPGRGARASFAPAHAGIAHPGRATRCPPRRRRRRPARAARGPRQPGRPRALERIDVSLYFHRGERAFPLQVCRRRRRPRSRARTAPRSRERHQRLCPRYPSPSRALPSRLRHRSLYRGDLQVLLQSRLQQPTTTRSRSPAVFVSDSALECLHHKNAMRPLRARLQTTS